MGPPTPAPAGAAPLEWCVTTAASVTAHVVDGGYAVHLLTADPGSDTGIHHDETLDHGLETLARVTLGPDDGLRAVLHAASVLTSQGGLVVYVGGPLTDDDARTLAALRQPGSAGVALVVDRDAFAARGRRGSHSDAGDRAATTAAIVQASGWMATVVDARTSPAAAWGTVVGGQLVGVR